MRQPSPAHWRLCQLSNETPGLQILQDGLGMPDQPYPLALANILMQRGIHTAAEAKAFFRPSVTDLHNPFLMKDMDVAVARVLQAVSTNETILVYGDYDVDGTTAVTLMVLFLRSIGAAPYYYVPDRFKEGYGVSFRGIEHAAEIGAKLIITLDCGTKDVEKLRMATLRGIDVIVCDHHNVGSELPPALALLNPKRPDCGYPFKELTGCGIGLKLATAIADRLRREGQHVPDPFAAFCDLAALSTACDIVPMTGENRIIAHFGMIKIRENPVAGLAAIKELSDTERNWDITDLLFFMGPRVNAAGRMEHAKGAVAVLLGEEPAVDLDSHNADRKKLTQSMSQEALAMIATDETYEAKASTVLVNGAWAKGVIGIVASRLIETHYRPTIVFTESQGNYVGSARSVAGFDLYGALEKCAPHITQFGGHRHAAGITLRPEQYPDFCTAFDEAVKSTITPEQQVPVFDIAYELPFEQLTARFMKLLNFFNPFGPENMQPVFLSRGVEIMHVTIMKEEHLKLTVRHRSTILEAVGFFMADAWGRLGDPSHVDMLYQPQVESFNNKLSLKLRIKDLKTHEFPA